YRKLRAAPQDAPLEPAPDVALRGTRLPRSKVQTVVVRFVETNSRAFSVQPDGHGGFLLKIDAHFILRLDDEETKAAVAHELGHVWIYTHHPYLHTEALANEIAARVVSAESLQKLYAKLWRFEASNAG